MVDAGDLTLEQWKTACEEYEEENRELQDKIERLLSDDEYRKQAVAHDAFVKLKALEVRAAALEIENAKLHRELKASVEARHVLRKQIERGE